MAPLLLGLLLVSTAAGSYNNTNDTRTLTNPHTEAQRVAVAKGKT